jgi:hypothetical protein
MSQIENREDVTVAYLAGLVDGEATTPRIFARGVPMSSKQLGLREQLYLEVKKLNR